MSEKSSFGSTPWEYMFMRKRNDIHVAGTFTVAEQRSLYAVCAGKERQLGVRNARAAVVVRVQRQSHDIHGT